MADNQPVLVKLRRKESGTPWGFTMQGGYDQGKCLYIQKVNPKSVAYKSGLRIGDGIIYICHTPAQYLHHQQAKMEIIRAGNELDLVVQRDVVDCGHMTQVDGPSQSKQRSTVEEESTIYKGYTDPNVQSRSFKILQQSLNYSEAPPEKSGSYVHRTTQISQSSMVTRHVQEQVHPSPSKPDQEQVSMRDFLHLMGCTYIMKSTSFEHSVIKSIRTLKFEMSCLTKAVYLIVTSDVNHDNYTNIESFVCVDFCVV
ncbi:hypothetical protein FSP39_006801 [Pinctada imbricata]|uniref:PDZ domain-containing protein n=1 Tax=Pinctada imbricata TaxID=66713 RepID=A0AA88XPG7_PINIB|nr:hypothetical protein FSP39_006801 [Pinctada imbricata]